MKKIVIRCPKCDWEYLPEEIYYPSDLGNARNICRDYTGKIVYYDGNSIDTQAEYTCDHCNCKFNVEAKITFDTYVNKRHDFSEDYSTPIFTKDRINLEEPQEVKVENDNDLWK